MAITKRDEEIIVSEFENIFSEDFSDNYVTAGKVLGAWRRLWALMERENNFSNQLGSDILDWQIGNWANDTVEFLQNDGRYRDVIEVNEQILKMNWVDYEDNLFHENAKRDIADAYADMGEVEKAFKLYEEYLASDPLWGWGWTGYYRLFKSQKDPRYIDIMKELVSNIKSGTKYRDLEDLCWNLAEEFDEINEKDLADFCRKEYELEEEKTRKKSEELLKGLFEEE